MKASLRIGLLLAVVALVYGNTLRNEFTMDDGIYILRNAQVTNASVRGLFAPNKFSNFLPWWDARSYLRPDSCLPHGSCT
jgi:hypothetical protein